MSGGWTQTTGELFPAQGTIDLTKAVTPSPTPTPSPKPTHSPTPTPTPTPTTTPPHITGIVGLTQTKKGLTAITMGFNERWTPAL